MPEVDEFLATFAAVLVTAGITTAVCQRLRLPVVFGYLVAGFAIGPNLKAVPLFADQAIVRALSELGVILLMFTLGLEFSLRRLMKLLPTVGLVAAGQGALMLLLGFLVGQSFGWSTLESFFTGSMIAVASTTIVAKAFAEQRVQGEFKEVVIGILIVQDLIAILLLAVLTTAARGQGLSGAEIAVTGARLAAFLLAFVTVGLFLIPRLLRYLARLEQQETLMIGSVGIAFASSLAASFFGYSVALGAFLAGGLGAESGFATRVEAVITPVRDLFAAVFFVAVGMLIDPGLMAQHWFAILILILIVIIANMIGISTGAFLTGHSVRTSVQAGMSLTQIGEFSFIIVSLGAATGAIRPFLFPVAIGVSAITTLTTPLMIRRSRQVAERIDRKLPRALQTFVALYGSWIARLRAGQPADRGIGRVVILLAVDLVLIIALVIGAALERPHITDFLTRTTDLRPVVAPWLVAAAAAVLAAPLVYGLVRGSRVIANRLARRAFPPPPTSAPDYAGAARRTFVVTVQFGVLLLCGAALAALTQPFLPSLQAGLVILAATAILALLFWRSARDLQGHARAGAEIMATVLTQGLRDHAEPSPLPEPVRDLFRSLGEPQTLQITDDSPAAGKTLAQVNLRGRTGATVLALRRAGTDILLPAGNESIRAGDLLIVAGSTPALVEARRVLTEVDELVE